MSTYPVSPTLTTSPPASRRTIVCGMLAGALLVAVPPLVEYVAGDFFLLLPVALVLMLVALPGLRRHQGGQDGPIGAVGLRMVTTGLVVAVATMVLGSILLDSVPPAVQDVAEPVLVLIAGLAALAAVAGLVMVSIGMLRAGVYPVLAVVLFGAGLVLALLAEIVEQSLSGPVPMLLDVLPPTLFAASGLGLLGLSHSARS